MGSELSLTVSHVFILTIVKQCEGHTTISCVAEDGRGVQLGAARALPGQGGGLHAPAARGQGAEAGGQPRGEVGGA